MEFFKAKPNINFLGIRKWTALFSIIICLGSIVLFFYHGLNLGLDFTGGTQIELSFAHPADVNKVRAELENAGFKKLEVQTFGDSRSLMITLSNAAAQKHAESSLKQKKTAAATDENASSDQQANAANTDQLSEEQKAIRAQLVKTVATVIPDAKVNSVSYIGAKVSSELAYRGILAVIVALLATMVYIAFRFEYRLAVSAAISLIHDPLLIMGIFALFHIEFDLTTLAAVLTILGYSLHDSIVVFDRVRENFRRIRKGTPVTVVNDAINQTLSRTVLSSGLTLSVVVVLFLLGGPTIHAFALALMIGIIVGTYSSIYVAGALAVALGLDRTDLLVTAKKDYDAVL